LAALEKKRMEFMIEINAATDVDADIASTCFI